jgi:hypothetical protein
MEQIEHVQRTYTESEILQFGKQQSQLIAEIQRIEADKKQAIEHFKALVSKHEAEVNVLAESINRGYEIVPTPCDVVMNHPTRGMKTILNRATQEVIRTIPMTDADKQGSFFE